MKYKGIRILVLVPLVFLNACFATKTITAGHRSVDSKEIALLYTDREIYEISDLRATVSHLEGSFNRKVMPPVYKLMKISRLDIYLAPESGIEIDTTVAARITIPYESIQKIEKTRFRLELLAIVPALYLILLSGFTLGSSF